MKAEEERSREVPEGEDVMKCRFEEEGGEDDGVRGPPSQNNAGPEPVLGGGWMEDSYNCTIVSACRDHQLAWETTTVNGDRHGRLTFFLCEILRGYKENRVADPTWREAFLELGNSYADKFHQNDQQDEKRRQDPQLEGQRDWVIFGDTEVHPAAHFDIRTEPDKVLLCAGRLHGVGEKSRWELVQRTEEAEDSRGTARSLEILNPLHSIIAGRPPPKRSGAPCAWRARCVANYFHRPLSIRLQNVGDAEPELMEKIRSSPFMLPGSAEDEARDVVVARDGDKLVLAVRKGAEGGEEDSLRSPPIPPSETGFLFSCLEKVAWYHGLLDCFQEFPRSVGMDRSGVSVKIHVFDVAKFRSLGSVLPSSGMEGCTKDGNPLEPDDENNEVTVEEGDHFWIQVENRQSRKVFVTLIEFEQLYGIKVRYPPPGGHGAGVESGGRLQIPSASKGRLSLYRAVIPTPTAAEKPVKKDGHHFYRLILTSEPADFRCLEQDGLPNSFGPDFKEKPDETPRDTKELQLDIREPVTYFVWDMKMKIAAKNS